METLFPKPPSQWNHNKIFPSRRGVLKRTKEKAINNIKNNTKKSNSNNSCKKVAHLLTEPIYFPVKYQYLKWNWKRIKQNSRDKSSCASNKKGERGIRPRKLHYTSKTSTKVQSDYGEGPIQQNPIVHTKTLNPESPYQKGTPTTTIIWAQRSSYSYIPKWNPNTRATKQA